MLVTNQSGIGRGYFDWDCVNQIHRRLEQLLEAEGIKLAGIYVCPHTPAKPRREQVMFKRYGAEVERAGSATPDYVVDGISEGAQIIKEIMGVSASKLAQERSQ